MPSIFDNTTRPREEVFFSRNDKNDPRLGQIVAREEKAYDAADIVILGCPQDEGVRRNQGREGAALAPFAIRQQFYRLTTFNVKRKIFDLGDIKIGSTLEATHDTHVGTRR